MTYELTMILVDKENEFKDAKEVQKFFKEEVNVPELFLLDARSEAHPSVGDYRNALKNILKTAEVWNFTDNPVIECIESEMEKLGYRGW